ncbi:MAG: FHA domain-containing protein [Solirubrobacterales bacterium]
MTEPAGDDKTHSGVQSDLSAGLRKLAASGIESTDSPPSQPDAPRSTPGVQSHPLPPLSSPTLVADRRPASPDGLVIADRILAAARHRTDPMPAQPSISERDPRTPSTADTVQPLTTSATSTASTGDTTVLPRTAVITSPDGSTYVLRDGDALTIGRVPGPGDLAVNHVEVSRLHVRLEMRLGQLNATDLGSTNGTILVSGHTTTDLKPQSAATLVEGDRLMVGADVPLCTVDRIEWQS